MIEIRTKNYIVTIEEDNDNTNPCDYDNLGAMICFHSRYNIGHNHKLTPDELKDIIKQKNVISLPIFAYEHGEITINTTGFTYGYDSGQLGRIYTTHEDILKWYKADTITDELIETAKDRLNDEIKWYDDYLNKTYYCYSVQEKVYNVECNEIDLITVDSCGGYASIEDALNDAKIGLDETTIKLIEKEVLNHA
jgi:hypothetical protein